MILFFKKILVFSLPVYAYLILCSFLMPKIIAIWQGPSTATQIKMPFDTLKKEGFEMVVLGNSRTYRGVNPDKLSFNAFNFSHDNDSFNQIFYKLEFIREKSTTPKYLIIGMDLFQFSFIAHKRNYAYAPRFSAGYSQDFGFPELVRSLAGHYLDQADLRKLSACFSDRETPFQRGNGQYINPGTSRKTDSVSRDSRRLDFQVQYLDRLVDVCKSEDITIFFVTMPTRQRELDSYTEDQLDDFNKFVGRYLMREGVFWFNYGTEHPFSLSDFTDITHLNEKAADRFSEMLDADIRQVLEAR